MVERSLGKEEGTGSILVIGFYFFSVYLKLHKRKSIKKVSKESGYGEIGIRTRLRTWRFIHGGSSPSSRKQHLLKNISSLYLILRGRFENERSCASSLKLKRGEDKRCSTSPCLDLWYAQQRVLHWLSLFIFCWFIPSYPLRNEALSRATAPHFIPLPLENHSFILFSNCKQLIGFKEGGQKSAIKQRFFLERPSLIGMRAKIKKSVFALNQAKAQHFECIQCLFFLSCI